MSGMPCAGRNRVDRHLAPGDVVCAVFPLSLTPFLRTASSRTQTSPFAKVSRYQQISRLTPEKPRKWEVDPCFFLLQFFFWVWYDRSGNRMEHLLQHIRTPFNAVHRLTLLAHRNSYVVLQRIQRHHKSNSLAVSVLQLSIVMCFYLRGASGGS